MLRTQKTWVFLISCFIFSGVFLAGFFIAHNKPLWLDERYSLVTASKKSYKDLFLGRFKRELNNAPLFYVAQKSLCDLIACDPHHLIFKKNLLALPPYPENCSKDIPQQRKFWDDPFSNIYFRLISLFSMALIPAILFYYFSLQYSIGWGAYSSLICLSSGIFWNHGIEVRAYIHLFLLTTLQILIAYEIIKTNANNKRLWLSFLLVNTVLAFTFATGALQTTVIGILFLFWYYRKLHWTQLIAPFILPLGIDGYYYSIGRHVKFWFKWPLADYFFTNVPWEILSITALFVFYALFGRKLIQWKFPQDSIIQELDASKTLTINRFLILIISFFLSYILVMLLLLSQAAPQEHGPRFYPRYLYSLAPISIVTMSLLSAELVHIFKNQLTKFLFLSILVLILLYRFIENYKTMHLWLNI